MTRPDPTSRALLALATHWDVIPADAQDDIRGALLQHLDEATSRSYVEEAVGHLRAADDIRTGHGDWRALLDRYLFGEDTRTGREDAAELAAGEQAARDDAHLVLGSAVAADLAALVRSQMDEAAELLDTLSMAVPDPVSASAPADPFAALEANYAAEDAFLRSPHGLEIGPARTTA